MLETLADNMIAAWRTQILDFDVGQSLRLLEALGNYHYDIALLLTEKGFKNVRLCDLVLHYSRYCLCARIRPVYFDGGPFRSERFKGTFQTVLLDRILLTAEEKGADHTMKLVTYAQRINKKHRTV